MRIYIAAAYGRREEMLPIAQHLTDAGHIVTSRWLHGLHGTPPEGVKIDSAEHWRWCAEDDLEDLRSSDVCLSVLGGGTRSRGGRHVEFGVALERGLRMVIVGDPGRENVFHELPHVEWYFTVHEAIRAFARNQG